MSRGSRLTKNTTLLFTAINETSLFSKLSFSACASISILTAFLLGLSSCVKISGSLSSLTGKNDFLKTEFIVSGPQSADGVSSLLVGLQLKNSDNSSVASYKPEFDVVSGGQVNNPGCTTSDKNGISACILKSIVPGQKMLELTNAKVGLRQVVTFVAPTGAHLGSVVSGALTGSSTANGSRVDASFGETFKGIKHVTQGGYIVRLSAHAGKATR